ncbi:hypothetical protein K450DRAFT_261208 [Umbelopsis ramanniana AG]|uniref:WWE domain-containing protein n=1 Tax=Umbelopsis ramanniana AG TaxID=1314678 RepID=A0AAD5HAV8_UMBRA|nr:uncharacterized protein K450DRAFT_261208 [Umbelopsis ramanniana AG]KAI8575553.1 hypothetical protein K450DRAFT_261208 [Umbelopsis ramanniana AG]
MANTRWVYASGSHWVNFDRSTSQAIEKLFYVGAAGWVHVRAFGGQVYVNAPACYVCASNGYRFTIARIIE